MAYILGLDLRPTAIGWAAIDLNEQKIPCRFSTLTDKSENGDGYKEVSAVGARIFPAGIDNLYQGREETPKNEKRREKRAVRRRLRRARARRKGLIDFLITKGFIPDIQTIEKLQRKDPYEIRARAVQEKIELEDLARIFLHFSKRRGFRSIRRRPEDDYEKATQMKQACEKLAGELNGKTLGQFWNEKREGNPLAPIRNKRGSYHWAARRDQYRDEVARIWQKQTPFYPEILTKDLYCELSGLLFDQIRFELSNRKKRRIVGTGELLFSKLRCPWEDRRAQKFRILHKVNDLAVREGWKEHPLEEAQREKLIKALSVKKEMTFNEVRRLLWENEGKDKRFNLEYKTTGKIVGNTIDSMLTGRSFFDRKTWLGLTERQKDSVWNIFRDYLNERIGAKDVERKISEEYGLVLKKESWPDKLKRPSGYCSYSVELLEKILPFLEEGKKLVDAIHDAGLGKTWEKGGLLPLPMRKNGFAIRNPVIRSVLFQLRKVVNLLVKEKGLPDEIIIETAKEIKANRDRRLEIAEELAAGRQERDDAVKEIRDIRGWGPDVSVSGTDILKYRLWKHQKEYCPYTCTRIPLSMLFTKDTEIDHILPYSMSMDNSMDNKVLCFSTANHEKGQNTPASWLGQTSSRWQIIEQAKESFGLNTEKWERFCTKNEEIMDKYLNQRLLPDTAYISRLAREYLERLYPMEGAEQKVRTVKGGITAELRNLLGLNDILRKEGIGPINHQDLRRHAIDAAVAALASPGRIQEITNKLQQNKAPRPSYAKIAEPWEGFGRQLAGVIEHVKVSHRSQRKVKGALHKEIMYWKEEHGLNKGKYITRIPLNTISVKEAQRICDPKIRELVLQRLAEFGGDAQKAFDKPLFIPKKAKSSHPDTPVYSVRVWENISNPILIRDSKENRRGKETNKVWVKPGENHHIEIFKREDKNGKYEYLCKVCSMWEAAQRVKNKQPIISQKYPEDRNARYVMTLSKGKIVLMKNKSGETVLARIIGISGNPQDPSKIDIEAKPIHLADVKLGKEEENVQRRIWRIQSLKDFEKVILQKVTVDPLGRVRRVND